MLTTSTVFMSNSTKCSHQFSWKSVNWLKHLNGATRMRGRTEMMISKFCLFTYFSFTFVFFFKRKGWFKAHSRPHSKYSLSHHENYPVYIFLHVFWMLHLVAHGAVVCFKERAYVSRATNDASTIFIQYGAETTQSFPSFAVSFMFEACLITKSQLFETTWWLGRQKHW